MQTPANEPGQPKKKFKPVVSAELNALFDDHDGLPRSELSPISDMQLLGDSLVALSELFRRAKSGKEESTDYVFRLATHTTRLLAELVENPSPLLLRLAHCNPLWPTFFSPKPGFIEPLHEKLKRLEIGKKCQLNVSPQSRWSWAGVARSWAGQIQLFVQKCKTAELAQKNNNPNLDVIEQVEPKLRKLFSAACALPPLSKSTAKQWMEDVGWPLILLKTHRHPEKHPELRTLGKHREKHTETGKSGSKTSESNIRDGIKKLITQALGNMATDR